MGVMLTVIAGLSLWIVLWALDIGPLDAFLITIAMVLVAATWRIVSPFLPGNRASR